MAIMRIGSSSERMERSYGYIYKAPGIPASRQLTRQNGVVIERQRGETTPDVVVGIGRTASGAFARLEQAVADQAAEKAIAQEIQALGSISLQDVELVGATS